MGPLEIRALFEQLESKLTLTGRKRVFEDGKELQSEDIVLKSKPEEFTKQYLIEPVFELLGCRIESKERIFEALRKNKREVDYELVSPKGTKYIVEAKPLNADLYSHSSDGAVNQIKDAFKLHDVASVYGYGIATDGNHWIFIDSRRSVVADIRLDKEHEELDAIIRGESKPEYDKDEVSRRFYRWYLALLYGGRYKDHSGKTKSIAVKDSLVESVCNVNSEDDRIQIAQIVMDRLIFIKFLESKNIIKENVIDHLLSSQEFVWDLLRKLFFNVMNTRMDLRDNVPDFFRDVPYLNGSLFLRSNVEAKNYGMSIKAETICEVLRFLNSFRFTNGKGDASQTLDPELLGYIFEMSMVQQDRKGTGAFYTPSEVTSFMCRDALEKAIMRRIPGTLRDMGVPEYEINAVHSIEDVYRLGPMTLTRVFTDILLHIRVCDNACGSGAFLLAAADVLFDIYYNVNVKAGLNNRDIALKKLILNNNIYGVDLNKSAIEIAKLRMWLWVVDSYNSDYVEPLPNIDYNIRAGNSLIGYAALGDKLRTQVGVDDFSQPEKPMLQILKDRQKLLAKYKSSSSVEAGNIRSEIEDMDKRLSRILYLGYFKDHAGKVSCTEMDFFGLGVFNWGMEFSEVFEEGGFDVIVGNPPYIQLQKMKDSLAYKYYANSGYKSFSGTGDIYALFYERSGQILKEGGVLSYITSNSWMKAKGGGPLRDYLVSYAKNISVYDMTDMKLFKDATVECSIVRYETCSSDPKCTEIPVNICSVGDGFDISTIGPYFEKNRQRIICHVGETWNTGDERTLAIMEKMESSGTILAKWGIEINYGIKTGLNEAFIIDNETREKLISEDSNSAEIISPVLRGRDVGRYISSEPVRYVIATFPSRHIDIDHYPAVKQYLLKFDKRVLSQTGEKNIDGIEGKNARKKTPNKWFETQDQILYWQDFARNKIAWLDLADKGRFTYVKPGTMLDATTFFFAVDDPRYLLGILNSSLVTWYFSHICATSGAGTNRWKKLYVEKIPVPKNPANKQIIETLVEKMIKDPEDVMTAKELDVQICKAYTLSVEETDYVLNSANS